MPIHTHVETGDKFGWGWHLELEPYLESKTTSTNEEKRIGRNLTPTLRSKRLNHAATDEH